ncbi:MAG: hypothetical protein HY900_08810 [Deltaproteobacteria bacterium]|nr:hypothetical protein [Deltaproteobacteria bacterium]
MNLRRFLAEAATLVGLAVACALVSNALAGKERKLTIPGAYPNATTVTARPEPPPLAAFEAEPAAGPQTAEVRAPEPSPASTDGEASGAPRPTAAASSGKPVPAPPAKAPASPAELLARFPAHGQPYVEISGEAAAWLHARGALFIDARRTRDFSQGHIGGARSFPVWEAQIVKERVEGLVAEGRDPSLPVILYCSGGDCEDSHMLAQSLFGAGFENLLVYRDGFPDWVRRGGAVQAGGPA